MNQQTRSYRKSNLSFSVVKGAAIPRDGKPGLGTSLAISSFDSTEGHCVNSSEERKAAGRKPWKGHGNPLGRDGVVYEVVIGSVRK